MQSQYAMVNQQGENSLSLVKIDSTLEASVPAVNLENSETISSIECPSATEFYITFHEAKEAAKAMEAWKSTPLAMLLSEEYSQACHQWWMGDRSGPIEKGSFMVHGVQVLEPTKLLLIITYVPLPSVVDDYAVTVNQWEIPPAEVPMELNEEIRKKSGKLQRLKQWVKRLFDIKIKVAQSTRFPIELNYDHQAKRAKKSFTLLDKYKPLVGELFPGLEMWMVQLIDSFEETTIKCSNCYVKGHLGLKLDLKGSLQKKSYQYTLKTYGEVKINTDWIFTLHKGHRINLPKIPMFKLPLTPWYLPGVFEFGPSFTLYLQLGYEIREPAEGISFSVGGDVQIPLDFEIQGDSKEEKSSMGHRLQPKIKMHPLKLIDTDLPFHVDLSVGLVPTVSLLMKMFHKVKFIELRLMFPQNLILSLEEKSEACRNSDSKTHLMVMWEQQVVLQAVSVVPGYKKVLAGRRAVVPNCSMCNTCISSDSLRTNDGLKLS